MGRSASVTWVYEIATADHNKTICTWSRTHKTPSIKTAEEMIALCTTPADGFKGFVTSIQFRNQKNGRVFGATRPAPSFLVV